ncbi:hypothetical protein D1007_02428 [Hordeum vulgare]|uniref:Pectinesterase inhibitor domain-containing protein n=1 Tax=Hordeum vulgare subsp. vulgare TaxID=112509 RepID=A0A8I6X7B4_HORVV|nr:uncharacterized protein LOC123440148 [Hordeum vulgare subsp. vulgare]KAE8819760.1 hypothetical protein D1007_02428 [Hordeum vulgare]KAI4999963.1 hypothetical protein ZWY2020_004552 [Hordeum vulgare]
MLLRLLALIFAAVLAASSSSIDARVVHPIFLPFGDNGRRLIGIQRCEQCFGICQEVHYRTLCSTLATLPGVTTPQQLLDAALRVTAAKSAMTEMRLDELMRSGVGRTVAMMSSLQSCRDSYASLTDSLQKSRTTLKKRDSHDDLMSELSAASTYSTDCRDIFDERPELKSPISGAQRHLTRLVSNCLDLAATIRQP